MAKPITDAGNELDADFSVEDLPTGFNIVIESRGGSDHGPHTSRNSEYSDGLRLLLERLGQRDASLEDIQVASSLAEQKPESERQIFPEGYSLPIQLDRIADKEALRLAIGRATGAFGKLPGAKAGTYSKRLRLRVSCSSLERMTAGEGEIVMQRQAVWVGKPTADPDELDDEVRRAISRARKHPGLLPRPKGSNTVKKTSGSMQRFIRDPDVVAWVLLQAGGKCEACEKPSPFKREDGSGFLEVHHVKTLASGGPDTVDNAIACCPNCHRELHYGENRDRMKRDLFSRVHRLFKH